MSSVVVSVIFVLIFMKSLSHVIDDSKNNKCSGCSNCSIKNKYSSKKTNKKTLDKF